MNQEQAEGAPRGTLAPAGGGPGRGERGRFSAQRKMEAVLRLVRGETLDAVSRELGVSGSTLSGWRDRFLAAGHTALKSRPADERDDEIQRLRAKVGEITMDNELLLTRCRQVEAARPLAFRRLKS
jgi:transposase